MVKWDLSSGGSGRIDLVAQADEARLMAGGSPASPQLCFQFEWKEYSQNNLWDAMHRLLGVSLELYGPESVNVPLVQTGLVPQSVYPQRSVCLPLSHQLIERISERASRGSDGELFLNISVAALAHPSTRGENATTPAPPSTSVRLEIYSSSPQSVRITALQWSKFLEVWGYPAVRFIPVPSKLPGQLSVSNPVAREYWQKAIETLTAAQSAWRDAQPQAAGQQLRDVILYAGLTWDAIWHPEEPSKVKDLKIALTRIGNHVPAFKEKSFFIPEHAAPDVKRILSWLVLLRDLNTLANPFQHVGASLIYPDGDIDALVTSVTSALRALPQLWQQYPTPDSVRSE